MGGSGKWEGGGGENPDFGAIERLFDHSYIIFFLESTRRDVSVYSSHAVKTRHTTRQNATEREREREREFVTKAKTKTRRDNIKHDKDNERERESS